MRRAPPAGARLRDPARPWRPRSAAGACVPFPRVWPRRAALETALHASYLCYRYTTLLKEQEHEALATHPGRGPEPQWLRLQRFPAAGRADQVGLERGAQPVPAARRPG